MKKISTILNDLFYSLNDSEMKKIAKDIENKAKDIESRKHLVLSKNELEELVRSKKVKYEDNIGTVLIDKPS